MYSAILMYSEHQAPSMWKGHSAVHGSQELD